MTLANAGILLRGDNKRFALHLEWIKLPRRLVGVSTYEATEK
jgi:hypothetical protein